MQPRRALQDLMPLFATVLACLPLASCRARLEQDDRAFCRATQQRLSEGFRKQIATLSAARQQVPAGKEQAIPADFTPWWQAEAARPLFAEGKANPAPLDELFTRALKHSAQVRVFSDIPLIRQTGIQEARGRFDTYLFVETAYEYTDEPVGSTLKTGGPERFKQWDHQLEAGLRKKLLTGADVSLSQRVGRTSNNSEFFVPDHQAAAALALTVTQPLLRGGGVEYNRSLIRIARIDTEVARSEFIRQTESHLLQLARAYWNLHLARALCVQKRKLLADTQDILARLEKRNDIDAVQAEILQARAAVARRRAGLVRTEMAVRNAEDRIKALVNDPQLDAAGGEIVPLPPPTPPAGPVDLKQAAAAALEHRPEIRQAFLQLKAAAIRRQMSRNELLPQLDLILETSVSGLDKAGRITDGWDDQWHDAHPGFLVGLRFDYPLENNAARARLLRRRLEIRQQLAQLQTTVDTVLLEVKISAREAATSRREVAARYASLTAAEEDLRILRKRWESHAGTDTRPVVGYLKLLLDAQDRLADAQEAFARAIATHSLARLDLQRAQGTLLTYHELQITETRDEKNLPTLRLEPKKPTTTAPAEPPRKTG